MAMVNPETVSESFILWLENQNVATFNDDLYLNQVPDSAQDKCFWVITSGGGTVQKLKTGERMQQYFISLYYRSSSGRDVERTLSAVAELVDTPTCFQLEGFETIEADATQYPSDNDVD